MPEFAPPAGWTPRTLPALRKALLAWFDAHRRDLPWRADRDPYRVWVSEVMLQQTTVAAVVPYFERFVAAFPTVADLAAADEQRRAAAVGGARATTAAPATCTRRRRQLVADHGGALPDDPAVWASLPGVGRYILGAVLSQAFDRRLPIVEANSLRVLARLFGYRGDPREGAGKEWVWAAAEAVLPREAGRRLQPGADGTRGAGLHAGRAEVRRRARWRSGARRTGTGCKTRSRRRPKPKAVTDGPRGRRWWSATGRRCCSVAGRRTRRGGPNMWEVPHGEVRPGEPDDAAAVRVAKELTGLERRGRRGGADDPPRRHAVRDHAGLPGGAADRRAVPVGLLHGGGVGGPGRGWRAVRSARRSDGCWRSWPAAVGRGGCSDRLRVHPTSRMGVA